MEKSLAFITLSGFLLRWCVSLHPYSGAGIPPMFGDYEAQRHWQEITTNLPLKSWYVNSTDNDLLYWGLDYPPLTAYHSYLCGIVAEKINPDFVSLHTSRGYESYHHKLFMRATVFVIDILVYVPAVILFMKYVSRCSAVSGKYKHIYGLALLLYPGIYLIDYGHFQYNNASLGLFIGAVSFLMGGKDCLGSAFFVMALNYKQMELYHALPFFFYLLGVCKSQNSLKDSLFKLTAIGLTVLLTFVIIWSPFLMDKDVVLQVVRRIFPLNRGVFEDKVASIWFSLSVLFRIKNYIPNGNMALGCLLCTTVSMLPSSLHLFMSPSKLHFRYALVNSSLIFFLFSFHVHEKTILLATIPACLLMVEEFFVVMWFLIVSIISMLPLLLKDGLGLPTVALTVLTYLMFSSIESIKDTKARWNTQQILFVLSMMGLSALSIATLTLHPPPKLPDLFTVLIALYSCGHFVVFCLYFHYRQFTTSSVGYTKMKAQ
ncbi:dolichyl pyrophosphate Man9GlcNAc2 alpha-1,3-glucosyltransferase-like isoform X1 [Oratosquilla oratoria]|uniref:dolichyl pyrophosphate Man9GlcNAc2 alpha-1,3-glucosyltransferase-like isoform X1 n=1 Tax=Oratosquilla oratoria TaxID=337810 RepID=UPI003F771E07